MNKLKDTLNLPQTDFSMRANLPVLEPEILKRWEQINLYQQMRQERQERKKFILHDGPPYANGDIHIGHAVNKVIKDIIVKSKLLDGFDVPYIPGWDCHGLPIELEVEKRHGKAKDQQDTKRFRERCRAYAKTQIARQKEGFVRLGVLADWTHPYQTMDYHTEANTLRVLAGIIERGCFYRGSHPVLWCLECESSLAEAEVEYQDKHSKAIDCLFRIKAPQTLARRLNLSATQQWAVAVWTTTPWTLPANRAVAIHPQHLYSIVDIGDCLVVVASELLESWLVRCNIARYEILDQVSGHQLAGLTLKHPFYDREVPLLAAEFVTLEAGSGLVHIAPAHGIDDFQLGQKSKLEMSGEVTGKGVFAETVDAVAGMSVRACDEKIISLLKQNNNLLCAQKHKHSYPHCWRHKTPVIYRAATQWFLGMDKSNAGNDLSLRQQALAACETIRWFPSWGQSRMQGMLQDRPDWCLSRQRKWGVPIALLVHKETGALHPRTPELIERVACAVERQGIEAWFEMEVADLLDEQAEVYEKVQDVLDVWFDSGSTCGSVLGPRAELSAPADLYLEGSDQYRGWFQSSLLTSFAAYSQAPYRSVLTHGFVVDAKGKKMSKSRQNVVAPEEVINTLGADVLRLWVAATDFSNEMAISQEILQQTVEAYRKIRNTLRFLLGNLYDFDPQENQLPAAALLALDVWIIDEAARRQTQIKSAYERYQFHQVYQQIYNFCSISLGGFYLDVVKDRLYTTQANSHLRRSCQTALFHLIQALLRWIAPILSFTAEEIYPKIPGNHRKSVFLCQWYEALEVEGKRQITAAQWQQILMLRQAVLKYLEQLRQEGKIGSSLDAEAMLFCQSEASTKLLAEMGDELRFIMLTSSFRLCKKPLPGSVEIDKGIWLLVQPSKEKKCQRCWHHCIEVGTLNTDLDICQRCLDNLEGDGEVRQYA